jgi:hypothetical protein
VTFAAEHEKQADEYLLKARETCREGLRLAMARAEVGDLDTEVIARFYATLGDVEEACGTEAATVAGYRYAALFLAYGYVALEGDLYGVEFFQEHSTTTLAWVMRSGQSRPAEILAACQLLRWLSGRPPLAEKTVRSLLAKGTGAETRLRTLLLPDQPELVGAGNEAVLSDVSAAAICRHTRRMPRRLQSLGESAFPEHFARVVALLANDLDHEPEDEDDASSTAEEGA